jgi:hypothetical protein
MKWIFAGLLLTACSTTTNSTYTPPAAKHVGCTREQALPVVDERVSVWVDDFFAEAQKRGSTCYKAKSVRFVAQDKIPQDKTTAGASVIGYCTSSGNVVLSEQVWASYGLLFNKALLFHELGHCVLQLDHAPESALNLMAPYMLSEITLAENWAELMTKLFSGSLSLTEENEHVVFDRHLMPVMR